MSFTGQEERKILSSLTKPMSYFMDSSQIENLSVQRNHTSSQIEFEFNDWECFMSSRGPHLCKT